MPSENAKAVAEEVIATLGKGGKVSVSAIARRKGYSKSVAHNPKQITQTKTYQDTVAPIVARMNAARDRAVSLLEKTESKAKYRDLIDAVDKLTKNIQLLTGGSTANVALGIKRLSDGELARIADADGGSEGVSA